MAQMFVATVYGPDGQVAVRQQNKQPLVFERPTVHRAWLSARNFDYPPGVKIVVTNQPKPIAGTSLMPPLREELVAEWDGKVWTDKATGQPIP
jgi:hypothetical protein